MNKYSTGFIILITTLLCVQCAKRGTPTGGDKDTTPPKVVRTSPENYSTNFDGKEINIIFNEFIKLEKPQEQIIISPPMSPPPVISPLGSPRKNITLKIRDSLQKNTTYVVNFGTSIVDHNEGNPLSFYKYIFSTGSHIDSLSLSGKVEDARLKDPEKFVSVMLYEIDKNFTDSLIYKKPPRYITNTLDSAGFQLTNLKEGRYQLVALKDNNNNYLYEPYVEKIGFVNEVVNIPTDTTYTLTLFKERPPFQLERPKQLNRQKLLIGYRGKIKPDSLQFTPLTKVPEDFEYRITRVPGKDSLHFWFKPQLKTDTLRLAFAAPSKRDTLLTRLTELKADSLILNIEPSGTLDFRETVSFKSTTPITAKNDELISVLNKDSVAVAFTSELKEFENTVRLEFQKNEVETYKITALPGAFTDFFGVTNDTLQKTLRTRNYSDYGNITVNLKNVKSFPVIIQLTTEKGEVKAEKYLTSETRLRFELMTPAKYMLRAIYDTNENGEWDTGDYLAKRQPEEIIYFPQILELRANWDVNQDFSL